MPGRVEIFETWFILQSAVFWNRSKLLKTFQNSNCLDHKGYRNIHVELHDVWLILSPVNHHIPAGTRCACKVFARVRNQCLIQQNKRSPASSWDFWASHLVADLREIPDSICNSTFLCSKCPQLHPTHPKRPCLLSANLGFLLSQRTLMLLR